jgi:Glycosyl hydrolase family 47
VRLGSQLGLRCLLFKLICPLLTCIIALIREWGWEVFQSIEKYCKIGVAYGTLHDVANTSLQPNDKMESFFLAETMKYFYLLFDPDTEVDLLNKHVFNTEAHPIRVFSKITESRGFGAKEKSDKR